MTPRQAQKAEVKREDRAHKDRYAQHMQDIAERLEPGRMADADTERRVLERDGPERPAIAGLHQRISITRVPTVTRSMRISFRRAVLG